MNRLDLLTSAFVLFMGAVASRTDEMLRLFRDGDPRQKQGWRGVIATAFLVFSFLALAASVSLR